MTELLCMWNTLFSLFTLTDLGFPFSNPALPALRLGLQPSPPDVKPNGQVTRRGKGKRVDPKAPWEGGRNIGLGAGEGLHLPPGHQEVALAEFLDVLALECKPCKSRNLVGLPTDVPGTQ